MDGNSKSSQKMIKQTKPNRIKAKELVILFDKIDLHAPMKSAVSAKKC
jgi:hypothetical protein